jgi:hypothetical protein
MQKPFFLFVLLFSSFCRLASQQAWTKDKGKYFAQIGTSVLFYNSYINSETSNILPLNRNFVDMSVSLYGEYGLTNYLTLSGQVPFKYSSSSGGKDNLIQDGSIAGFSNINLGLTGRLFQKGGFVFSTKIKTGLPFSKYDAKTGLRTGFDATTFTPSLLVGLGATKFFTSAEVGREFRNNGYTNRNFLAWQIGKFFHDKKYIFIIGLEYLKSIGTSTYDDANSKYTALYLSTQSYLSPTLKFGYYIKPTNTLWFSLGFGLPGTDDVPASPGISLSYSKTNF